MSQAHDTPAAAEILRQRDRVLASDTFASSKRLSDFLDYLIGEALADRGARLKELAIGMSVFGRDASFDPRIDAIVRVEAGRLRAKLREYYEDAGRDDPVRITIPKGGYVPKFTLARPEQAEGAPRSARAMRLWPLLALVVITVIASGALLLWRDRSPDETRSPSAPYSIAVLPLRDWSSQPKDYFSEAMTDALIARLSERPELRVTSLGSVLRYRNSEILPGDIAQELGVGHIVEGTVLRESDRVRITAQLIDARLGRNLWSTTYERPMASVLSLQETLAAEIARQLVGELLPAARAPAGAINPAAYEAYLKGRYWRNRLTAQGFSRGIRYFLRAIDLQPDYAEAYSGLAACHCQLGGHGIEVVAPGVALPEARRLATKALELDADLAEPSAVLGIIKFKFDWDAAGAERLLQRAIDKNPSLFEAYLWRSQVLEGTGRHQLAVEQARLAHRVNPLSVAANLNLGWQLFQAGRVMEAEAEFDKLIEFDPEFWGGHWGKGHCYRTRGMLPEAVAAFSRAVELEGGHSLAMAALGHAHAMAGQREEALEVVTKLRQRAVNAYVSPLHIAMVYAGLGEPDAAFEWLDKAYEAKARSLSWLTVTREFDVLREDPRYERLVTAIGIDGR